MQERGRASSPLAGLRSPARIIALIRRFFDDRATSRSRRQSHSSPHRCGGTCCHTPALDIDLYARIAPELYLKRLIVGGFERVYEINRNFRNEGLSIRHNPEFTMLEWYQAYSDYHQLMDLTQELITMLVDEVHGTRQVQYLDQLLDFDNWQRMTMREAVVKFWPQVKHARPSTADRIG